MPATPHFGSRRRPFRRSDRGFYLIGLLMAIVIIMILAGRNYQSASGTGAGSTADSAASLLLDPLAATAGQIQDGNNRIDQTKALGCSTNRTQAATELTMLTVGNMGELPSPEIVHNKAGHIGCPEGGKFQYDEMSRVYCTKHSPAPAGVQIRNL